MSESSWSSDEEWTTIAAMVRDTQDNGSNAVEGDTEDDSSVTNRQQVGSNTQGTNATLTVDESGYNDTPITDEPGINDTPTTDQPGNNDTPTADESATNDTPMVDEAGTNDTPTADELAANDTPMADKPITNDTPMAGMKETPGIKNSQDQILIQDKSAVRTYKEDTSSTDSNGSPNALKVTPRQKKKK